MKFCPTCQIRYDEEIIRFCTKDGTPLVTEEQPHFIEMPSESLEPPEEDDFGAETIIRRKPSNPGPVSEPPKEDTSYKETEETSQRMVIPTSEPVRGQQVRTKEAAYHQPPQKSNTALIVLTTVLGTVVVLGGAVGVYWLLTGPASDEDANANANFNLNANQDTNLNTSLPIDNTLFDPTFDTNVNTDVNANVKTPTPTRTPTPTPSPTPDEDEDTNTNVNVNAAPNRTPSPANTKPTPSPSPTPRATPEDNRPVSVGNLNSRAINLSKPVYPPAAKVVRASGQVPVQVTVDENGNVTNARATGGHPFLRQAAETAARQSKFNPVRVNGKPVKAVGTLVYNFVNP